MFSSRLKYVLFSPAVWSVVIFILMVFVMGLLQVGSPDLGFHLKSAEWMISNKEFIYTDTFSYGSEGNRYFDLQWMFQLLIYFISSFGEPVLVIVDALLITISFMLLWYRFSTAAGLNASNAGQCVFALIAILFVQPLSFEIRPHVLSWIYLNALLVFLEQYKKGNRRTILLLPILMLLWVNTHSLAILGLVVIGIYNLGGYIENKKWDRKLFKFSVLSLAAFLINPYFIDGLIYPFTQFSIISGDNLLKSYIGEFQSPFTAREIKMLGMNYFTSPLLLIHLSAVLSVFSIFRSLIQKKYTDAILLFSFMMLLFLALKNYGYYLMVCLPLCAKYVSQMLAKKREKALTQQKRLTKKSHTKHFATDVKIANPPAFSAMYNGIAALAISIGIFISIATISDAYPIFRHSPYRYGFSIDRDQLPVDATAFLKKHHIQGKMLNHLDFGGYLMANYPEKVFIDGRMEILDEDFFAQYVESLTIKNGVSKLLDIHKPAIIIFPYLKASNWWEYFISTGSRAGYKAVYFDGLAVIYLRSATFPQIQEVSEQQILSSMSNESIHPLYNLISSPKHDAMGTLINGLWQKQRFSLADQNQASYCFTHGFDSAAIRFSAAGIQHSTVHTPNIFKNLSIYYTGKKMFSEAALCEEKSE